MSNKGSSQVSVLPILTVNFVGTLGFSIVLPFLIFLVIRLGGNAFVYGIMGATYSFFQLIGAPILGRWSDRFGRRKILLLSQIGTLFSWGIFIIALRLPVTTMAAINNSTFGEFTLTIPLLILFLARAFDGLTGGNVSVANAYLADVTDEENRNKNFGRMAMFSNLGFVIGPALAGLLGGIGMGEILPVLVAFGISAVAVLLIQFMLPESSPCVIEKKLEPPSVRRVFGQEQKECYEMSQKKNLSLRELLKLPGVSPLLLINFLVFLGFNFFYITFPVHAAKGLNWKLADTGAFFSVLSIMMVLVQGPVLGFLSKRASDWFLACVGSFILCVSFFGFLSANTMFLYISAGGMALGNGLMWPSILSLLSKSVASSEQGAVQGASSGLGSFASILGLIAGGILYESWQNNVFVLAGIIIAIVAVITLFLAIRKPVAKAVV